MKRIHSVVLFAAAALASAACTQAGVERVEPVPDPVVGSLSVTVAEKSGSATKADPSAYLVSQDYERRINSIQLFVYYRGGAQDGNLAQFESLTNSSAVFSMSRSFDLPVGSYTVCALVNAPELSASQRASLDAFRAVPVSLADNSVVESAGFVMSGEVQASVADGVTNSCEISLQRVLNRIVLNKITNKLATGSLTVNRVWLANIVTGQTVSNGVFGNGEGGRVWAHQFSRNAYPWTGDAIISTFTCPALTSKAPAAEIANGSSLSTPGDYLMYAFANFKSEGVGEDASAYLPGAAEWTPVRTRLVIEAQVNGVTYYYPYDMAIASRNQTSTLDFVISGPGLDDPQGDPATLSKDSMSVGITVADWVAGECTEIVY